MDKVNHVEMKHVSELAIIGPLLKSFKTWVVPGMPTVILTRTRGGMLEIELVRLMVVSYTHLTLPTKLEV